MNVGPERLNEIFGEGGAEMFGMTGDEKTTDEAKAIRAQSVGGRIEARFAEDPDWATSALDWDSSPDERAATKLQEADSQKQDAEKKKEKGSTAIAMDNSVSNVSNPSTTTMSSRRSTGNDADVAMAHSF